MTDYPPPPPGNYPPPMPPQGPPPPPGYSNSEEKTWALVSTFGAAVGALISCGFLAFAGPLIALLAKGKESPTIRRHALAALNFQAPLSAVALIIFILRACAGGMIYSAGTFGLYGLVSTLLWLLAAAVTLVSIVFGVLAGMKANEGQEFKYPVNLNLFK